MTRFDKTFRRTIGATLTLGLIATAGCMSNMKTVKSVDAKQPQPMTGDEASKDATKLSMVKDGPAKDKHDDRLQVVALFPGPEQPVGIAVSKTGRMFMSFPRWADPVKNTVVELKDGKVVPFPDEETNAFDGTKLEQYKPQDHLVSAQAIEFDGEDRLWVVDAGSFNFAPNILHAPKLWCYDITTGQRVKSISFPTDVALKMTYLNDVRFDLKRGSAGTAYITDSGAGGIIVVDLASGTSWRHLDNTPSVLPTPGLIQQSEGKPLMMRTDTGETDSPDLRSDGIALSPDGKTLYYTAVASHDVYSIATDLLADHDPNDEQKVQAGVKKIASKSSGNDGILCDGQGQIYTTDFETNSISRIDPSNGATETVVQDARLLWPDTLAMSGSDLYFTVNQLAREPMFHAGDDLRKPPYVLFKIKVDGEAKAGETR